MRSGLPISAGLKIAKGVALAGMVVALYGAVCATLGVLVGLTLSIILGSLGLAAEVRPDADVSLGPVVVGACTGAALGVGHALRVLIQHAQEEIHRLTASVSPTQSKL
jgi:hypothetical protein